MAVNQSRRARAARRRSKRVAAADNNLTAEQWAAIQDAWGGCAYCGATGVALQKDTVLPISRGGRYTLENVVPACRSCNASKSNDEVTSWMRRKRLDERAFLTRYVRIGSDRIGSGRGSGSRRSRGLPRGASRLCSAGLA